jgi:archaellum component FlaD/FlaE
MSELPWENKKVAEVMSSVEEEESSAKSSASGEQKSPTPPIPDILANAFADTPMEEAKIEISEDDPVQTDAGAPQTAVPSFGDLPDLSALSGTPPNAPPSEEKEAPLEIPPFMNPPSVANESDIVDSPAPFTQTDEGGITSPSDPSSLPSPSNMEESPKKRSPPPLFEPFIHPGDEQSEPSLPELEEPALPFTPENDQLPFDAQVETQPTPTPDPFTVPVGSEEPNPSVTSPVTGPSSDPFAPAGNSVEFNPFESSPGTVPPSDSPVSSGNPVESNPFTPSSDGAPSTDPFASPDNVPLADPFASAGVSAESNPFAATPNAVQPENPFGAPISTEAGSSNREKHSLKNTVKLPIDVGSFKKNLEGISGITKDFLRNLTKGKSLIERMEDMREEVDIAGSASNNVESKPELTPDASPFGDNPFEAPDNNGNPDSFSSPFDENNPVIEESVNESMNPFMENEDAGTIGDIRQFTPVENPVMEMKEEYLLDNDVFDSDNENDTLSPASDELTAEAAIPSTNAEIPAVLENEIVTDAAAMAASPDHMSESDKSGLPGQDQDSSSEFTEPAVADMIPHAISDESESAAIHAPSPSTSGAELSKQVLSRELKDIKTTTDNKFENLEDEMGGLKESLNDMSLQFSSIHAEVEEFSNKISGITESVASTAASSENVLSQNNARFDSVDIMFSQVENKVSEFASSIAALQSDNASMKSGLSQIEESISELVESYTALLVQLHESLQENESKFAILTEVSSKIDAFGPRVEFIEKTQEESKSTSKEFSRSISSMVDNLGKVSSEFQEFRQESEQKNTAVLEKMDSLTEYVESELKKLGARSYKGFGQNVHLSNIVKNSSNMKLCMEWLEFLMELVGRNNLPDILSYYEELGWITEKVRMELLHYADGIDFYMEKPDWKLTPDDHVKSIWFIESLAGMKVDKNRLSVIERDIEKVKKGSEIYGI